MTFAPSVEGSVRSLIAFSVGSCATQYIKMSAEVQRPAVVAENNIVDFTGSLFYNVESELTAQLVNISKLPAKFRCGTPVSAVEQAHPDYDLTKRLSNSITVEPMQGVLDGETSQLISIRALVSTFDHQRIPYLNHFLPVYYEGRDEPIVFHIVGAVAWLNVHYHLHPRVASGSAEDQLKCLDFGKTKLREVVKKTFYITNGSPIAAVYRFSVSGYPTIQQSAPSRKPVIVDQPSVPPAQGPSLASAVGNKLSASNRTNTASNAKLGATLSKATNADQPRSAAGSTRSFQLAEVQEDVHHAADRIKPGNAVAFEVSPSEVKLGPNATVAINVSLYNNVPGVYHDTLVCETDLLPTHYIPVRAELHGCPLQFQLGRPGDDAAPIIRLTPVTTSAAEQHDDDESSRSSHANRVSRVVKISNPTYFDMTVNWEGFLCSDQDTQLIDCLYDTDDAGSIKLGVRIHEGHSSSQPFSVEETTLKIPAHTQAALTVKFQSPAAGEFLGFIRGTICRFDTPTIKPVTNGPAAYSAHVSSNPDDVALKLFMTGHALDPKLLCTTDDETGSVHLACSAFEILQASVAVQMLTSVILRNPSPSTLTYRLAFAPPFSAFDAESQSRSQSASLSRLTPGQSTKIRVACNITKSMLVDALANHNTSVFTLEEQHAATEHEAHVRSLKLASELGIIFSNGKKQTIPLSCTVKLPFVRLSQSELVFGDVVVGSTASLSVALRNTGLSAFPFTVSIITDGSSYANGDESKSFTVSSTGATLDDFSSKLNSHMATLEVVFKPRRAASFGAAVQITSPLLEGPLVVTLQGQGTYDQTHGDEK